MRFKNLIFVFVLLISTLNVKCQVLVSLLLGDNLNTGKIEFGLDGGINFSTLEGINNSKNKDNFNLGFYFDIKLKKNPWIFHTGVLVKSTLGSTGITPYSTGDASLDSLIMNGEIKRSIEYFHVPIMLKYTFKSRIFLEGGFMLGLKYNAKDVFYADVNENEDLTYTIKNKKAYNSIDAGLMGGIGWRIIKGYGMNLGVRYF